MEKMQYRNYRGKQVLEEEAKVLETIEKQILDSPEFMLEEGKVTKLNLTNSNIHDLSPLRGLKHLKTLHLRYTDVKDISPLASLENLRELHLGGTSVSDLTPLRTLKKLRYLGLRYTYITDISPLLHLKQLELVDLVGTIITEKRKTVKSLTNRGVEIIL